MLKDPAARIRALNQEVKRLFADGSRASALERALEVLGEAEATLDPLDATLAESIYNVAAIQDALGDFASARTLYKRAIDIALQSMGQNHPWVAMVLTSLAVGWWGTGDLSAAAGLVEQAWEIRRKALGDGHPEELRSRYTLAALYASMGEFERAEQILGAPTLADVLLTYGQRFQSEGRYELARLLYERAAVAAQRTLGANHPIVARSLNDAGFVEEKLGRYAEAEALYGAALEILGESDDDPLLGEALNNLGWLRYVTGDYRSAEDLLQRALDIRRRTLGKDHPAVAETLSNLSGPRVATRNLIAAEELLTEAIAIQTRVSEADPKESAALADMLNNLGVVLRAAGRPQEAGDAYQKAMRIREELQGSRSAAFGESVNNWGGFLYGVGRYQEAYDAFDSAYQIRRDALGENHPAVGQSLINAASASVALGNSLDALGIAMPAYVQLRQALGPRHPTLAEALLVLADVQAATGQPDSALASILRAAAIQDASVGQAFAIATESERLLFAERLRQTLEASLFLVVQDQQQDAIDQLFDLVLRWKGLVTEFAAAQRAAILVGRYPDLQPALQELTSLRWSIARATLAGPGPEDGEAHEQRLNALQQQREDLERRLANQLPEMALDQQLGTVGGREVGAAIPEGAALVEFVRFEPYRVGANRVSGDDPWLPARYVAFVVLPGGRPQLLDLGEADPIDEMVAGFRVFVSGQAEPSREAHALSPESDNGSGLRSAVVDPLLTVTGGRTRILIAPDGDLCRLPFEALPTNGGRLIDEYDITYLTSARDIVRFGAARKTQATPPLVVADPDFDLRGSAAPPPRARESLDFRRLQAPRHSRDMRGHPRFPPLPATRSEGERIAEALGVAPALGADALDPMVRAVRSPTVLHVATHGFFFPDQPRDRSQNRALAAGASPLARLAATENPLLRSGLALAGVNAWLAEEALDPSVEDGVLTAEDVAGMDLLGTELVVLSACDTGLGSVRVGEGVFGLRRAFVVAGARALVMSLWKVPDQPTAELMQDFYRRMDGGEQPAMALRAARRSLMERYPDPLNWGAFIYQGDPGAPGDGAG